MHLRFAYQNKREILHGLSRSTIPDLNRPHNYKSFHFNSNGLLGKVSNVNLLQKPKLHISSFATGCEKKVIKLKITVAESSTLKYFKMAAIPSDKRF